MSRPACFDPKPSGTTVRLVPRDRIVDLLRATHALEKVTDYRAAMIRGEHFPPIAVLPVFGRYLVADGHKRFTASRGVSEDTIPVEIWGVGRVLADQARQFAGKSTALGRILVRFPFDANARKDGHRLWIDTVGHWRRIAESLRRRA